MTAHLYDIERDRPAAELREWSDSDARLATLLDGQRKQDQQRRTDARRLLKRGSQVVLLCAGCWLLVIGVLLWK